MQHKTFHDTIVLHTALSVGQVALKRLDSETICTSATLASGIVQEQNSQHCIQQTANLATDWGFANAACEDSTGDSSEPEEFKHTVT